METKVFDVLSQIDCNAYTEKKNGLTYLSWAWAWAIVKKNYPSAKYEVKKFDGKPYLFDEFLGYLVETSVSIEEESISMQLPVMDGANKAQRHVGYTYQTKFGEKAVIPATMFDINTAIMRCLTKNLAMFGLGLYIYRGEDLPIDIEKAKSFDDIIIEFKNVSSREEFENCMKSNKAVLGNEKIKEICIELSQKFPKK